MKKNHGLQNADLKWLHATGYFDASPSAFFLKFNTELLEILMAILDGVSSP